MKEADYFKMGMWGWHCPDCKSFNETSDDPGHEEAIFCDKCGNEFIPVLW